MGDPLRNEPSTRPHPFAALVVFIAEGIAKLRVVHAKGDDAHKLQVFWRGLKDVVVPAKFFQMGGTEMACMSTTMSQDVAANFAASSCPLILKVESLDFMNRGADISFLSVFP